MVTNNVKHKKRVNRKLKSKVQTRRKGTRKSKASLEMLNYPTGSLSYAVCKYLQLKKFEVAESTFQSMKTHARHIITHVGQIKVCDMSTATIDEFKLEMLDGGSKGKVINGCYTILREICQKAEKDSLLKSNLMEGLKNVKVVELEPNPFSTNEIQKLLSTATDRSMSKLAVALGSATALRISELICIDWGNVEYFVDDETEKAILHIDLAKPLNRYKVTKTPESDRSIELSAQATLMLRKLEKCTKHLSAVDIEVVQRDNITIKKDKRKFIFYNEQTGQPWLNPKQFAKQFFTPFLKQAGVDHRGPNQLRHTCASYHFINGANLAWIASLLGHRSVAIVEKHYAKRNRASLIKEQAKADKTIDSLFRSQDQNSIVVPLEVVSLKEKEPLVSEQRLYLMSVLQLAKHAKNEKHREQLFSVIEDMLKEE